MRAFGLTARRTSRCDRAVGHGRMFKLGTQFRFTDQTDLRSGTGCFCARNVSVRRFQSFAADGTFAILGTSCVRTGRVTECRRYFCVTYRTMLCGGTGRFRAGRVTERRRYFCVTYRTSLGGGTGRLRAGGMTERRYHFCVTYRAVLRGGTGRFCACRVSECGNHLGSLKDFSAERTVYTLGLSVFRTSRIDGSIDFQLVLTSLRLTDHELTEVIRHEGDVSVNDRHGNALRHGAADVVNNHVFFLHAFGDRDGNGYFAIKRNLLFVFPKLHIVNMETVRVDGKQLDRMIQFFIGSQLFDAEFRVFLERTADDRHMALVGYGRDDGWAFAEKMPRKRTNHDRKEKRCRDDPRKNFFQKLLVFDLVDDLLAADDVIYRVVKIAEKRLLFCIQTLLCRKLVGQFLGREAVARDNQRAFRLLFCLNGFGKTLPLVLDPGRFDVLGLRSVYDHDLCRRDRVENVRLVFFADLVAQALSAVEYAVSALRQMKVKLLRRNAVCRAFSVFAFLITDKYVIRVFLRGLGCPFLVCAVDVLRLRGVECLHRLVRILQSIFKILRMRDFSDLVPVTGRDRFAVFIDFVGDAVVRQQSSPISVGNLRISFDQVVEFVLRFLELRKAEILKGRDQQVFLLRRKVLRLVRSARGADPTTVAVLVCTAAIVTYV